MLSLVRRLFSICQINGLCLSVDVRVVDESDSGLGHSKWLLAVPVLSGSGDGKTGVWVNKWLLGESQWLLTVPVLAGGGNSQSSVGVDEWLVELGSVHLIGLNHGKWLLSVPVKAGGGYSQASIRVKVWLLSHLSKSHSIDQLARGMGGVLTGNN